MFRTTVSMVGTTFAKPLYLIILPKIGSKHVKGSKLGEGDLGGLKRENNLVTARAALGKNRNYWLL